MDHTPPGTETSLETDFESSKHVILNRLLLVTGLSGIIIFAADLTSLIQTSQWLLIGLYSLTLFSLFLTAVLRRIAVLVRAATLLIALVVLSLATMLTDGFYSPGQVFLLAIPFFAGLVAGKRGRTASLVTSVAIICLAGGLIITGQLPQPDFRLPLGNQSLLSMFEWIAIFTLIAIGGMSSASLLSTRFIKSIEYQSIQNKETARERAILEVHIQRGTGELQRRLVQTRTAAEINRTISRMLDIDQLLPDVCELVSQRFGLYYVGIFLIEDFTSQWPESRIHSGMNSPASEEFPVSSSLNFDGKENNDRFLNPSFAVLKAGSGEAGRQMLLEGHRLAVGGDSMIGWATANHKPRIAQNVGQEVVRFNNPHLPLTRSELALPILIHEGSSEENFKGQESQSERMLGAMTIQSTDEAAFDQDDILILQGIADSLASAIENSRLFSAIDARLQEIRALHSQYLEQAWRQELTLRGEIEYTYDPGRTLQPTSPATNLLEFPIQLRDQVIGFLSLEPGGAPDLLESDQHRWSPEERALIEGVTSQAALALENARLLEETRRKANLERTATSITSKMWASASIEGILKTALQELSRTVGVRDGWIELWPDENNSQSAKVEGTDQTARDVQTEMESNPYRESHG